MAVTGVEGKCWSTQWEGKVFAVIPRRSREVVAVTGRRVSGWYQVMRKAFG